MLQRPPLSLNQWIATVPARLLKPIGKAPLPFRDTLLEKLLNDIFREAVSDGDFDFLEGRWIKVHARDAGIAIYITKLWNKLVVSERPRQEQTSINGNVNDFILLASRREDPDTLFFRRRLVIEGDVELGLEVKNLIDSLGMEQLPAALNFLVHRGADFVQRFDAVEAQV